MNKDLILKRYRDSNEDEGKLFALSKGRKYGVIAMITAFMFYSVYNLYSGNYKEIYPLLSIFFIYLSSESLGIYIFSKNKGELIKIVIGAFIAIFSLYSYVS